MSNLTETVIFQIKVGSDVQKIGGDYTFQGKVVACFQKRSGSWRVVVENKEGILHIFNPRQLEPVNVQKA